MSYFALNFNSLGLKKLITTSYHPSPIMGQQMSLFVMEGTREYAGQKGKRKAHVAEINEVPDLNKDGAIDLEDVEHLLQHDKNVTRPLKGDDTYGPGDFRSKECVERLRQADIAVTNPPSRSSVGAFGQLVASSCANLPVHYSEGCVGAEPAGRRIYLKTR